MNWMKVDHFTGEEYKKKPNDGSWHIIDYVSGDLMIEELFDGKREVSKNGKVVGVFRTLKAAKAFAETI